MQGREGEKGVRGEGWNVCFWNVARLERKDKEFYEGMREWDVVALMETWCEEKGWERRKHRMPGEYRWVAQMASRENRKGRAKRGKYSGGSDEKFSEGSRGKGRGDRRDSDPKDKDGKG